MTSEGNNKSRKRELARVALVVLVVLLLVGGAVYQALRKPAVTKSAPIEARLELAAGQVLVTHGEGTAERRAISGTALRAKAKVRTEKGARALVRLPDGSTVFLRGGTTIRLESGGVALEDGEYWLDAPPEDRQPLVHRAAEASVSASEAGLAIKRAKENVEIYVARGMAVLSSPGGRAEVTAGELAVVKAKAAPKVEALAFWEDWTGGMADFGSAALSGAQGNGAIFAVDHRAPPGSPSKRLQIKSQSVHAVIRGGLSETKVDQTFYNPSPNAVEGWYWFTVPERASVTGFAVETNGRLVEGELIGRREASTKYTRARRSGHSPAILEWVDSRTYRARIYPILGSKTRRVVLRYIELRPIIGGKIEYLYPMAGAAARIGEFSLSADLGDAGKKMKIATLSDARVEGEGKRVTMRRSGYTPRADFQLEATLAESPPPLVVARYKSRSDAADYLMARYTPTVDWDKAKAVRGDVVVVVDTSAAGDEGSRQLKASMAEALLRAMSKSDRFALVALDARPKVLFPAKGLAPADDASIAKALEALADHSTGGATDMSALFDVALGRVHDSTQPALVYVGDGVATSGALTGEQLVERMRRALSTSRARLFTVGVGPESDTALLAELARAGGGQSVRVNHPRDVTGHALDLAAAFKTPTLTEFEMDLGAGLDEPFISAAGKVSRGSEVVVLARTHHDIPSHIKIRGRLAGQVIEQKVEVVKDDSLIAAFVPRLWAAEYVRRLLGGAAGPQIEKGRIAALGLEYGLMTPFTSFLALESEQAYRNMGIKRRRSPLWGSRLTSLDPRSERRLRSELKAQSGAAPIALGCDKRSPTGAEPGGQGQRGPYKSKKQRPQVHSRSDKSPSSPPDLPQVVASAQADDGSRDNAAPEDDLKSTGRSAGKARPAATSGLRRGGGHSTTPPTRRGHDEGERDKRGHRPAKEPPVRRAKFSGRWRQPIDPATCSAASSQPLARRALLWRKRLATAKSANGLLQRHIHAMRACELADWRSERAFLMLMQKHIKSEGGATLVLSHFRYRHEVQRFVAKLILRRAVDQRIIAAVQTVLFGGVDWNSVDLKLSAIEDIEERITKLREMLTRAPDDPQGQIRLVELLARAGHSTEALSLGRRLRDRGLMSLTIARQLGDVLAREKLEEEAVRTYSEIVEFDPHNVASRRLLGDIYLSRGWYEPAYRQYKTATDLTADALGWLRLAAAAAGAGRVDEALRLERRVASSQGRPGPSDPRRWARMWSAARLARMIVKPPKGASKAALERKLKELQIFRGPAALVLLTWEDLSANVMLVSKSGKQELALGEHTDAAPVGLSASLVASAELDGAELLARLRSLPRIEPLVLQRHDIRFDGKSFVVSVKAAELAANATKAAL